LPWALRTGMDETGGSLIPQRFQIEFLGRVIRMHTTFANTVGTVSSVSEYEPGSGWPRPVGDFCDDNARPDLVFPPPVGQVSVTADGADANAAFPGSPPTPDLWRRRRGAGAI